MNSVENGILIRQRINSLRKELFRKSIHLCSGFVPFMLSIAYWPVIFMLVFAVIGYTICEVLRMHGKNIPVISKITEIAARKRDENHFVLGPVTLVLGILIAALCLPLPCATVGIYALSFGDGLASLVGKMCGRIHIPLTQGKTVAGSLACFTAVFLSTGLYCHNWITAAILGFCASFIEVLPLKNFDNLIIPISIGSIYFFFFYTML